MDLGWMQFDKVYADMSTGTLVSRGLGGTTGRMGLATTYASHEVDIRVACYKFLATKCLAKCLASVLHVTSSLQRSLASVLHVILQRMHHEAVLCYQVLMDVPWSPVCHVLGAFV